MRFELDKTFMANRCFPFFQLLIVCTNSCNQTQLREVTLQEENAAYEKAISNCENKIQEKMREADSLRRKLKV